MDDKHKNTLIVITSEEGAVRGGTARKLKVEELAVNVNLFLEQMSCAGYLGHPFTNSSFAST
jgi:hypothetical protein